MKCTSARSPAKEPGPPLRGNWRSWPHLGVTVIEVMPVAEFPGASAGATTASTCSLPPGSTAGPTIFRRFVDRAHALGLGVILDVVYNHIGPDGNYLNAVCRRVLHRPLRERMGRGASTSTATMPARCASSFVANAGYWIDEFHFDGLRLDATQQIFDDSPGPHPGGDRIASVRAGGGRSRHADRRGERTADTQLVRPSGRRRLWPRCAVERRFSPLAPWWP